MPWKVKLIIVPLACASSTNAINCAPVTPSGTVAPTAYGSSLSMSGTTPAPPSLIATNSDFTSST